MAGKMKDSGVEWIGDIPDDWETKKLKYEFINLDSMRIPLSSEDRNGLERIYDYYGASGIIDKIDRYIFDDDLILIGEDGANLLARHTPLAFIARGKFWVNNHAHILKPNPGNNLDYMTYQLENIDYTELISGSAQPKLTQDKLANVTVIVPQPAIQQKIANYLNSKCSEIDAVIAAKQKQSELLIKQRQAIINETVTKGLDASVKYKNSEVEWIGEVPDKWEVQRLKYLLLPGNEGIRIGPFGSSLKLDDTIENGEYKVYGQENLIRSDFKLGKRYIDESKYQELANYSIFSGDILISMMGTIGKCEVVPPEIQEGIMDSHLTRIRGDERRINNEFLALLISDSCYIQTQFDIQSKGSIMNGLNSSIVKELIIALPTIIEQQLICNYLKSRCSEIDRVIQSNTPIITKLKDYRQSIIYEAVTGKIAV